MVKKYIALYMSIALHLGAYCVVIYILPFKPKSPQIVAAAPPISIEFLTLAQETHEVVLFVWTGWQLI